MKGDFYADYYSKLIGRKITGIVFDNSDPRDIVYGLKFDDGSMAWILQDPEGNGPGHLDISK